MSRDVYAQDLPRDIGSIDEIGDDWRPGPLGVTYESVMRSVHAHAPQVRTTDAASIHVEGDGVDVEVSIDPRASPLMSFAFHDRSGDPAAGRRFIHAVLSDLGIRALDPTGSESGIFQLAEGESATGTP